MKVQRVVHQNSELHFCFPKKAAECWRCFYLNSNILIIYLGINTPNTQKSSTK